MERVSKTDSYLRLTGGYVAAMAACFLVSVASLFFGVFILSLFWQMAPDGFPDWLNSFLMIAVYSAAGFAGVVAGTSLLPRQIRQVGSIILLAIALWFYFWFGPYCSYRFDAELPVESWFLLLGCLIGVRFFWRREPDRVISKISDWLVRYLISVVASSAVFMAANAVLGICLNFAWPVLSRFIPIPQSFYTGLICVGAGALAVLTGTMVLVERQRRFGCLFLFVVVMLFYCSAWMSFQGWVFSPGMSRDFWLVLLGCSLAVLYFWLRKPRGNQIQQTPPPSKHISDSTDV